MNYNLVNDLEGINARNPKCNEWCELVFGSMLHGKGVDWAL
jgi:hypothetical protein